MALNPSIILSGVQPDFLGTIDRGNRAAAFETQMGKQNALTQLYREQGPQIAAGDKQAVNALARLDAPGALDINQTFRGNRMQESEIARRNEVQDRDFGLRIQEYKQKVGEAEAQAEAQRIENGVARATQLYQSGDLQGVNALLESVGEPPLSSLEEFPAVASLYARAAEALKTHSELTKKPEPDIQIIGNQAVDKNNLGAGATTIPGLKVESSDSAAEQEISRLMETGMDRNTAIKIKDGVYKVMTDPVTRESFIIDLATRQVVSGFDGGAQQPATPAAGQPPAAQPPATPQGTQPQATQPLSFGNRFEGAGNSFGTEGFLRGGANAVADTLGLGLPYPDTSSAQRDFAVLREGLTNDISNAYDGRVPAFLLQNIQNLTPQAGSVFEGPEAAQDKLRALGRSLSTEWQNIRKAKERRLSPTDAEALARREQVITSSLSQVTQALEAFQPDTGIRPEVLDRLKAYQ